MDAGLQGQPRPPRGLVPCKSDMKTQQKTALTLVRLFLCCNQEWGYLAMNLVKVLCTENSFPIFIWILPYSSNTILTLYRICFLLFDILNKIMWQRIMNKEVTWLVYREDIFESITCNAWRILLSSCLLETKNSAKRCWHLSLNNLERLESAAQSGSNILDLALCVSPELYKYLWCLQHIYVLGLVDICFCHKSWWTRNLFRGTSPCDILEH